jgi:signal transduction histidine kinase
MSDRGREARRRHRLARREMRKWDHRRTSRSRQRGDTSPRHNGPSKKKRTPEEERYREAKSRANARIGWTTHLICYGTVLALILVSSRSFRATLIVALSWGIGLACHYFAAIVAPGLRKRWIAEEMELHTTRGANELDKAESDNARSLEDLSASIAHEIRNPVTAAKSLVQQMGEDPISGGNIEYARVALQELDRVERSISHLLRYARDEDYRFDRLVLPELIDSVVVSMADRIDALGVAVDVETDAACEMSGDAEKLRRILLNLLGNALDALTEARTQKPCVVIMAGENLAGSEVWMRIRDNGPGIDPKLRSHIFDPFYTTKDHGTGLGLALSKKIVEAHGGAMEVRSESERGTEFLLTFPKSHKFGESAT